MELTEYTTPGGTILIECEEYPGISIMIDAHYVYYKTEKTHLRLADNATLEQAREIAKDVFYSAIPVNKARSIAKEAKGK